MAEKESSDVKAMADKEQPTKDIKTGKWFMFQNTNSLRSRLKRNPELGDDWVKGQLKKIGKEDYWFPGVADAIRNKAVSTEQSYLEHPGHEKFRTQPGNEDLSRKASKKLGEHYTTQVTTNRPWQEELQKGLANAGGKPIAEAFSNIGKPLPLSAPVNDLLQGLIKQYQQEQNSGIPAGWNGPGTRAVANAYQNGPSLGDIGNLLSSQAQNAYGVGQNLYQQLPNAQQRQQGLDYLKGAGNTAYNYGKQGANTAYGYGKQGVNNVLDFLWEPQNEMQTALSRLASLFERK